MAAVGKSVSEYVDSLGLDAYLVGGAVRDQLLGQPAKDEDFVVPGVDQRELRTRLEPHGRLEDLEVAGRLVGVRLYPHDREMRGVAPTGIEFAPPRTERSTGPGRHDFEIVADATLSLEDDMARRDFTVNAIARRLSTGELVDPFGGEADLRARVLRAVGERSFAEDPLRIIRGLRFVSELDLQPDDGTLAQMREHAGQIPFVSGERIGGGLAADGLGELSRLLLGSEPRKALRIARETGVLVQLIPEFEPAIGYQQRSANQPDLLDEHIFSVVQETATAGDSLAVRLGALLHDLGKPEAETEHPDDSFEKHAALGAGIARNVLARLRYPARLSAHVVALVRNHAFWLDGRVDAVTARRFLARHGDQLALDLAAHRAADIRAKTVPDEWHEEVAAFRRELARQLESPHRVSDLEIGGAELIDLGYEPGPKLGKTLQALLEDVLVDPARNNRGWLRDRARELLAS